MKKKQQNNFFSFCALNVSSALRAFSLHSVFSAHFTHLFLPRNYFASSAQFSPFCFFRALHLSLLRNNILSPAKLANNICCFNRHYAEASVQIPALVSCFEYSVPFIRHIFQGSFVRQSTFFQNVTAASGESIFYDSVTGHAFFVAPRGRTFKEFEGLSFLLFTLSIIY